MGIKVTALLLLVLCAILTVTVYAQSKEDMEYLEKMERLRVLAETPKNELMASLGVKDTESFPISRIVCYLIFGAVGFVAFMYGKSTSSPKPTVLGILLSVYPYFVKDEYWMWAIGVGLCLLLYFTKD